MLILARLVVSIILMMTLIASLSFQKIYSPNDVSEIYKKAVNSLAARQADYEGLAADTLVKTPDGYKPISEILVGDIVVCFDLISKQICESKVISVDSVFSNKCQAHDVVDDSGNVCDRFIAGSLQQFLIIADNLKPTFINSSETSGKSLVCIGGLIKTSSKPTDGVQLYGIKVSEFENFFITKHDVLTHNFPGVGLAAAPALINAASSAIAAAACYVASRNMPIVNAKLEKIKQLTDVLDQKKLLLAQKEKEIIELSQMLTQSKKNIEDSKMQLSQHAQKINEEEACLESDAKVLKQVEQACLAMKDKINQLQAKVQSLLDRAGHVCQGSTEAVNITATYKILTSECNRFIDNYNQSINRYRELAICFEQRIAISDNLRFSYKKAYSAIELLVNIHNNNISKISDLMNRYDNVLSEANGLCDQINQTNSEIDPFIEPAPAPTVYACSGGGPGGPKKPDDDEEEEKKKKKEEKKKEEENRKEKAKKKEEDCGCEEKDKEIERLEEEKRQVSEEAKKKIERLEKEKDQMRTEKNNSDAAKIAETERANSADKRSNISDEKANLLAAELAKKGSENKSMIYSAGIATGMFGKTIIEKVIDKVLDKTLAKIIDKPTDKALNQIFPEKKVELVEVVEKSVEPVEESKNEPEAE